MYFSVNYHRDESDPKSAPAVVGWFLQDVQSPVIYYPPERVKHVEQNKEHVKSASRCPAVINMESRYFLFRSPVDINISFARDKNGRPGFLNNSGTKSNIRGNKLGELISITSEVEWRHPDRPTIQLRLPYTLIADELVYVTQLSPFMHYAPEPLPGTIFGGRFPINVWPRPLMWAFEWHDIKKPIIVKRGDPLFYCMFEVDGPDRSIQLVEAEKTPELDEYVNHVSGAVNYVGQTFSLFKEAERVRPEKLLTRKKQ